METQYGEESSQRESQKVCPITILSLSLEMILIHLLSTLGTLLNLVLWKKELIE